MIKNTFPLLIIIIVTLISFSTYNAYADVFAKIDSIQGDVVAKGFENDIAINSFQFGVKIPVSLHTGTGQQSGPPTFADLVITKTMDKSSPALAKDLFAGTNISKMEIFLTKTSPKGLFTFAHYTLENVLISSYSVSSGGDTPTETIGFNYEKLSTEVFPQNPDGSAGQPVTFCWDNVLDKECTATSTIDNIPPVTTATPSGTAGNNGWFRSIVSVILSATDNLSGVASTSYTLDGSIQTLYTGPITVTGNGTHVMTFNSTDNVGNVEPANALTIKIDNVPPTVTGTVNTLANVNGWYNHPLQVSWAGTDATSGVASCDSPTNYSGPDSSSIALTGHCTDNAGNVGSATVTIKYDSTPPTLTLPADITVFPTSPTGTVVTFSNTDGTAASATDATSGLAGLIYAPPSGTKFSFGTAAVTVSATDNAGNTATGSFHVTVLTPKQASQKLISIISSFNLDQGTANSLDSKLNAAISSLNSNQNNAAKNQLNAFINAVNAQTGKKLTTAQASQLVIYSHDIINSIS